MLILDGIIGAQAPQLLARLQEETLPCSIILYDDWLQQHAACHDHDHNHAHPEGIIYLKVSPEIAYARVQENAATLDQIKQVYAEKEEFFLSNINCPKALQSLPVVVLNGNIDFQTDFAHFYNHLFYIRRLYKNIEERKEIAAGIHQKKSQQRRCC
jgi:hypothetical protein